MILRNASHDSAADGVDDFVIVSFYSAGRFVDDYKIPKPTEAPWHDLIRQQVQKDIRVWHLGPKP
jgi:hypothetical protein